MSKMNAVLAELPQPNEKTPLSALTRALREVAPDHDLGYRHVYQAVVDGTLPMVWMVRGRWFFRQSDLPAIAARLGLRVQRSISK